MPSQKEHSQIKGWGADLDPKVRPAFPKERTPPRYTPKDIPEPSFQTQGVRVFHSIERPTMTPIFGSTVPPVGLSGKLREFAFKMSENDVRHWMILLFADRVNMVEGLVDDLRHGYIPNIFKEMGLQSEFKHNKAQMLKRTAMFATVAVCGYFLLRRRKEA